MEIIKDEIEKMEEMFRKIRKIIQITYKIKEIPNLIELLEHFFIYGFVLGMG